MPIAMTMAVLMLLLPISTAMAQSGDRTDQLFESMSRVGIEARSSDPESVRYLKADRSSPDMWGLESRLADKSTADAGSFRLNKRFSLAGSVSDAALASLNAKGVHQYDREIVVGTLYGPDGDERFVAALRYDLTVSDDRDERTNVSALVPILNGTDLDELQLIASELAETMKKGLVAGVVPEKGFGTPASKSTCRHYCIQDFETDVRACTIKAGLCVAAVTTAGIACIFNCPATGPGVIPCLILCGVGDVILVAACLLDEWFCKRAAGRQRTSCIAACPPPPV